MSYFSIPISVKLASDQHWESLNDESTAFGIVRFHFFLDDLSVDGEIKYGEPIGVYRKPKGVTIKRTKSETTVIERVVSRKSVENFLAQREELSEIAADILAKSSAFPLFNFGSSVRSKISEKLLNSLTLGEELSTSLKATTTESVIIENELPADFEETMVSVPAYVRREVRIFLAHIDYLKVNYRRSTFGLRKRAKSDPPVTDFRNHHNRVDIGKHIATAFYWQLVPNSSCFLLSREHKIDVKNATEVLVCPPQLELRKRFDFPHVPTLYQIARAAFPKKWIWRKSPTRDWSEEELMAIEYEEVKGKTGWWFRHGSKS